MATIGYFIAIAAFRKRAPEKNIFPLITITFATVLLLVNFLLLTVCNSIGIEKTTGGLRAIITTLWWILLSIFLLMMGIRDKKVFKNEKILGIILLFLTMFKIGLYDLDTMEMNKKIIVLMLTGGLMMLFSYFLQSRGYLSFSDENPKDKNPNNENTPSPIQTSTDSQNISQ